MRRKVTYKDINQTYPWIRVIGLLFIIYYLSICPAGAQRMDNVAEHSKYIQAVDEYRPAPGQYVNDAPEYEEGDTEDDMIRKCTEYLAGDYTTLWCSTSQSDFGMCCFSASFQHG